MKCLKRKLQLMFPVMLVLALTRCGHADGSAYVNGAAEGDSLWVWMEAGPCLQACPLYRLSVRADGRVHYEGVALDGSEAIHDRRMGEAEMRALDAAIRRSGYFSMDEKCCDTEEASDHPTTMLDIAAHGDRQRLEHYLGDPSIPSTLAPLEASILEHTGAKAWVVIPRLDGE